MNNLTVVLLSCLCCANLHRIRAELPPVTCYECSTERYEYYCGDPFNKTVRGMRTTTCSRGCAKLLKKPQNGPIHVVRTCADSLDTDMKWEYVCMRESRSGDGKLCFCDDDYCNTAPSWGHLGYARLLIYLCIAAMVWGIVKCIGDEGQLTYYLSHNQHMTKNAQQIHASLFLDNAHCTTNTLQFQEQKGDII